MQKRRAMLQPRGALAIVGAWKDVGDKKIDALVRDIYVQREKDTGRAVKDWLA